MNKNQLVSFYVPKSRMEEWTKIVEEVKNSGVSLGNWLIEVGIKEVESKSLDSSAPAPAPAPRP